MDMTSDHDENGEPGTSSSPVGKSELESENEEKQKRDVPPIWFREPDAMCCNLVDSSTKKDGIGSLKIESAKAIPQLNDIPQEDWRIYIDARIARFESALESILNLHDDKTLKKAELVDRLRGEWSRIQGEYQGQKRYTAFGVKAFKLMEGLW